MRHKTIYLAGGFYSGWQDLVQALVPGQTWLDPRTHGLHDEGDYTKWDCEAIEASDIVFAYLEAGNPGGHNLGFEIGYAVALGKQVIFVEENTTTRPKRSRYTGMLRAGANWDVDSLRDGIKRLHSWLGITDEDRRLAPEWSIEF